MAYILFLILTVIRGNSDGLFVPSDPSCPSGQTVREVLGDSRQSFGPEKGDEVFIIKKFAQGLRDEHQFVACRCRLAQQNLLLLDVVLIGADQTFNRQRTSLCSVRACASFTVLLARFHQTFCGHAGAPYDDVVPYYQNIVDQFEDRVLWGTDWPHPNMKSHMPDDGELVDYIPRIARSVQQRQKLLVQNPMRLYWGQ
ncbi:MAG: amidohydrolase family protein [Alphaproteobacteria bacterium]|jgi:hypothetical protein|nr:amidohydrolase family protein [Alphaproteobacteria bacterium]